MIWVSKSNHNSYFHTDVSSKIYIKFPNTKKKYIISEEKEEKCVPRRKRKKYNKILRQKTVNCENKNIK